MNNNNFRIQRTRSIEELPAALHQLLIEGDCTHLGIVGGDGSIHQVLNALLASSLPQVPLLLLRGGSMNMLARAFRLRGASSRILQDFVGQGVDWPTARLSLLEVDTTSLGRRYGFIFGSTLTARCLELQEQRFGGGYTGLARLLAAALTGVFLQTRFWKEHSALLEANAPPLLLDGLPMEYLAVVAATVKIELLAGWISALPGGTGSALEFPVRILGKIGARGVIRSLPRLLLGRPAEGIIDREGVRELDLHGDFSLDGEIYRAPDQPISVRASTRTVEILRPDLR